MQHFPEFLERQPHKIWTIFLEIDHLGISVPFHYFHKIYGFFGSMVHISEIKQLLQFLETFPPNFCPTCYCFEVLEFLVEIMKSALN